MTVVRAMRIRTSRDVDPLAGSAASGAHAIASYHGRL